MRIAAGVLFIIVALANLFGGLAYAGLGGLVGVTGDAVESGAFSEALAQEGIATEEFEFDEREAGVEMKKAGGMLAFWGMLLLALGGLNIAAGVMLFTAKSATFVMVVAGLEVAADLVTIVWTQTFVWATIGIVTAALAFVAAKSLAAPPSHLRSA